MFPYHTYEKDQRALEKKNDSQEFLFLTDSLLEIVLDFCYSLVKSYNVESINDFNVSSR